jgi:malate permease and related proteins
VVVYIFSWENEAALISIMESGMGPMISAGAVASMAGLAPRLSSAIVGYGILISFFTTWVLFNFIA